MSDFDEEVKARIAKNAESKALVESANAFMLASTVPKYCYNFSWMGRPIIQYPQDIVALQEIIWRVRPDMIIETGIAHGGSLIMNASILALIELCNAQEAGTVVDPANPKSRVLGIDIEIRPHNRTAIEQHPMFPRIAMIEGSSTDQNIVSQVREIAGKHEKIMVILDSNHTHDHVLEELRFYAPLVSLDSYCIVFDTIVEDLPAGMYPDRPWDPGNNPKTAVWQYLKENEDFVIDREMFNKLLISVAPDGFLKRTR